VTPPDRPLALAPLPANVIHIPSVKQARDFSCGAAATLAILRYWREEVFAAVDEAALYGPLRTSEALGTDPEPMAHYLRSLGLRVDYRHGQVTLAELERAVDARQPPVVDLQAWSDHDAPWATVWDAGHYVVMVGYDETHLFFMDPSILTPGAYAYLPRTELAERWHDISGEGDERLERMAIFVAGDERSCPPAVESNDASAPPSGPWPAAFPYPYFATKLG
jgi:predicted double-glycine peptidase